MHIDLKWLRWLPKNHSRKVYSFDFLFINIYDVKIVHIKNSPLCPFKELQT